MPVPDATEGHVKQNDAEEQLPSVQPKTVHILLGFFFMLNVLLCSGYPGIPFVFYQAGILVATVTLVLVVFIGWNCAIWMVEVMARAQGVTIFREWQKHQQQSTHSLQESVAPGPDYTILITRKFEPSELCEIFFGRWCKYVYMVILVIFTFLCLPGYATLAGSAWAVNLPLNLSDLKECSEQDFSGHILPVVMTCRYNYWFCLMLFAIIVVPLSLIEPKNQMAVQVVFGLFRFVLLGGMIGYCFVQLVLGHSHQSCTSDSNGDLGNTSDVDSGGSAILSNGSTTSAIDIVLRLDYQGWLESIPIFVFSILLHQAIPTLTHPVRQKKYLRGYFNTVFATVGLIYLSIGILASLWFNSCVNETVTLNWDVTTNPGNSLATRILSYYITLFPSLDVCSVYPLVVTTMVNNLYTVLFGRDSSEKCGWCHFAIRVAMRLGGAIIPILVALWISNLHYILNYAGLVGFFICFFFPTVLQLSSQWVCKKTFSDTQHLFPSPGAMETPECSVRSRIGSTQTNPLVESYCNVSEDGSTYDETFGQSHVYPEDTIVSPFGEPYLSTENSVLIHSDRSGLYSSTETTPLLSSSVTTATKVCTPPVYQTPYSTMFSHPASVVVIGVLGLACFCLSVSNILLRVL